MSTNQTQIAIIAKNVDYGIVDAISGFYTNEIIVVTPEKRAQRGRVIFYTDNEFLDRADFIRLCNHPRPAWLYQQFLKYHVVLQSRFDNTLIVDGDSLLASDKFLKPATLFYTPKRIETKYSRFIEGCFGANFRLRKNYITNQMNFNKFSLASTIEKNFGPTARHQHVVVEILKKNPSWEFSEYQCYAAWAVSECGARSEEIKVFRRHDLVEKNPVESLKKYDVVAFETAHRSGFLRTAGARLFYRLGVNLG